MQFYFLIDSGYSDVIHKEETKEPLTVHDLAYKSIKTLLNKDSMLSATSCGVDLTVGFKTTSHISNAVFNKGTNYVKISETSTIYTHKHCNYALLVIDDSKVSLKEMLDFLGYGFQTYTSTGFNLSHLYGIIETLKQVLTKSNCLENDLSSIMSYNITQEETK